MKLKIGYGRWSDEFKQWIRKRYNLGWSSSMIAIQAHEELGANISRNAVIGLVHRMGAGAERMKHRMPDRYDSEGMRTAMITLPGPAWAIEDMSREDVRGIAA